MPRPSFSLAWSKFLEVNLPVDQVGNRIGGNVQKNTESGVFQNACPIRMSYVLNSTGVKIPHAGYAVVSGADKKSYIFRVNDMIRFLEKTFGQPDKIVKSPRPSDFAGFKGLLVIKGHGWTNATGHVTLWNGSICSDTCHMMSDPDNGHFVPDVGYLWVLQ
jgi:hypothetical protein